MLTPDQEKMREAAKAASPGPWTWWTSNSCTRLTGADGKDGGVLCGTAHQGYGDIMCSAENREHIATNNPAAILALLDQVEAQGWKPIEEAPKDGTSILLYTADGQIEGYWEHRGWEQSPCYATYDGAGGVALTSQPTHYRPLPPPPEAA